MPGPYANPTKKDEPKKKPQTPLEKLADWLPLPFGGAVVEAKKSRKQQLEDAMKETQKNRKKK